MELTHREVLVEAIRQLAIWEAGMGRYSRYFCLYLEGRRRIGTLPDNLVDLILQEVGLLNRALGASTASAIDTAILNKFYGSRAEIKLPLYPDKQLPRSLKARYMRTKFQQILASLDKETNK